MQTCKTQVRYTNSLNARAGDDVRISPTRFRVGVIRIVFRNERREKNIVDDVKISTFFFSAKPPRFMNVRGRFFTVADFIVVVIQCKAVYSVRPS